MEEYEQFVAARPSCYINETFPSASSLRQTRHELPFRASNACCAPQRTREAVCRVMLSRRDRACELRKTHLASKKHILRHAPNRRLALGFGSSALLNFQTGLRGSSQLRTVTSSCRRCYRLRDRGRGGSRARCRLHRAGRKQICAGGDAVLVPDARGAAVQPGDDVPGQLPDPDQRPVSQAARGASALTVSILSLRLSLTWKWSACRPCDLVMSCVASENATEFVALSLTARRRQSLTRR